MTNWNLPWDGGCRCDRVRIRISAPPVMTMACHCRGCQRMTSSAYSLGIIVPEQGFSVTQGEPVIGGLHGAARHYFCSYCMSWIYTRPEGLDDLISVRPTMLDDASWFTPFIETWTKEKVSWASTPAVHSYKQTPPFEDFHRLLEEYSMSVG